MLMSKATYREGTLGSLLQSICYLSFDFILSPNLIHPMYLTHQKLVLFSFCHCREEGLKQSTNSTGHC